MPSLLSKVPISAQARMIRAVYALPTPLRRLFAGRPVRLDGQELALDAQVLLRLQKLAGGGLRMGDADNARRELDRNRELVSGARIEPVAVRELTVAGGDGELPARLYTPAGIPEITPLLVFYHGGGWVLGNIDSHDNTCRYLAKHAGIRVLSVDYRLAPEHPFPAAADDAVASFRWAVENAASLGADPSAIAVGGDSAGGNLAAVTSHLTTRDGGVKPAFQLLLYPGTDASVRRRSRELFADGFFLTSDDMDWFADHYCPDVEQRCDPRFSVNLAEDLSGLPPAYISTAGFDPLRDEGEAYGKRLAEAGVPVVVSRQDDLIHGYISFIGVGQRFREALSEAVGALRSGLALRPVPVAKKKPVRRKTTTRPA